MPYLYLINLNLCKFSNAFYRCFYPLLRCYVKSVYLLFVPSAFLRLPALLVEHFLALVIVVDLITFAGKIVPGG
jgi:hypothetical protein